MEPDVIRIYSSSPPPMEDGAEEEEDDFGDFGGFSGVPNSISFTEFDTPTTLNQSQALNATSPPELINNKGVVGFSHNSTNRTHGPTNELSKANGVVPAGHPAGSPTERTVDDTKKILYSAGGVSISCNGEGAEVLTNGFATFEVQGSPPSQNSVHFHKKPSEDVGSVPVDSPEDEFADFAAFSTAEGQLMQTENENLDTSSEGSRLAEAACQELCNVDQGTTLEDNVRDTNGTGPDASGSDSTSVPADELGSLCSGDRGSHTDADFQQRDVDVAHEHFSSEPVCTKEPLVLNGVDVPDEDVFEYPVGCSENDLLPEVTAEHEVGRSDEKGSENETETETETETSFGRPLSTDALEEYGDMSTTGSVPSPPLQEETATPADHSQLGEDDDEDFGDFGDVGSFGGQGFADFDQPEVQQEQITSSSSVPPQETASVEGDDDDDFGDFDTPKFHNGGTEGWDGEKFSDFPVSDSFGNFNSAVVSADCDGGWNAFEQPEQRWQQEEEKEEKEEKEEEEEEEEESWATFSEEQSVATDLSSRESEPTNLNEQTGRTDRHPQVSLSSRLERLFQSTFPQPAFPLMEEEEEEEVASLRILLEPPETKQQPGPEEESQPACSRAVWRSSVWMQLQDIHEAFGLRHQWGGSHCNKALLCCLGIDTRNILFTGQKKQPVIVPMYAASLGMLEPTKEPVKPVSAVEMIASIAQTPPMAPEKSSCPSDTVQEALPPVQFDWSSSGLTNPLDASGGSSLLNLDFFGPVEDSGSTSSPSIPGVDPELFELTTAKLDPSSSGSRVADAFARLMSTMEKTSTSTRKPRKDENLSEEAAKVIAGLPDLSFMQAKVLMFPATLTPLGSQATPD
ncbi:hypothetical protein LDENG_00081720 [Lucifuga dentata]|nr:hypothetical protein LDENG_00081720 [Lucifuga dentata]